MALSNGQIFNGLLKVSPYVNVVLIVGCTHLAVERENLYRQGPMQETFQSLALTFGKRISYFPPIVCKQARTVIGQINRQSDGLLKLRKPVGKWVT